MSKSASEITLVMLSGGIDSVYSLYRILTETDDEVLVHHINNINKEARHVAEKLSCDRIVKYLQEHTRQFSYSESTINSQTFPVLGWDVVAVAHTAGVVARSYTINTGKTVTRWIEGYCEEEGETPDRLPHFKIITAASCHPYTPPRHDYIKPLIPKADEAKMLPKELLAMTWTCRRPIVTPTGPKECGVCHTCEIVLAMRGEG